MDIIFTEYKLIKSARVLLVVLIFTILTNQLVGCASHSNTTYSKTESTVDADPYLHDGEGYDGRVEVKTTETTSESVEHDHDSSPGIFSILGDIIALPFRAVGALLSAIF